MCIQDCPVVLCKSLSFFSLNVSVSVGFYVFGASVLVHSFLMFTTLLNHLIRELFFMSLHSSHSVGNGVTSIRLLWQFDSCINKSIYLLFG